MQYLFYLGRILYGGFFLVSGINHFTNVEAMAGYAGSKGVPMPKFMVIFSGLLIFLGGLWVLTGAYVEVGVFELAFFLIPVSFKMHDFWNDTDPSQKAINKIQFMKNMALLGGALMLLQIPASNWGWTLF